MKTTQDVLLLHYYLTMCGKAPSDNEYHLSGTARENPWAWVKFAPAFLGVEKAIRLFKRIAAKHTEHMGSLWIAGISTWVLTDTVTFHKCMIKAEDSGWIIAASSKPLRRS